MKPAINEIGKKACTGCFGCYNICPFNAIQMIVKDGFFIPKIDEKKCTKCGLCQNNCPVINNKNNNLKNPKCYASRTNDNSMLMVSSSGGIFGELAKEILSLGGIVFGAGWDNNFNLKHFKIEKIEDLSKIQGSKYLQSDIGRNYDKILKLLKKNKKVLFCGTPCQVAALNISVIRLKDKYKKNLLTCDLVCHGVPSVNDFKKYLKKLKVKYKSEIESISFRSKRRGWADYSVEIKFKNGKTYSKSHKFDLFIKEYLKNTHLRKSCLDCKFSKISRQGDITLGDLWGASKETYNFYGVSMVLTNNSKGEQILKRLIKSGKIKLEHYPLDKAINENPRINGYIIKKKFNKNPLLKRLAYISNRLNQRYKEIVYPKF